MSVTERSATRLYTYEVEVVKASLDLTGKRAVGIAPLIPERCIFKGYLNSLG